MKDFWRIIRFSSSLWRSYVAIGALTLITAIVMQFTPFLTKGIVDAVVSNLGTDQVPWQTLLVFTGLIFASEVGLTLLSNITGYIGDLLSVKLNRLLSESYYEHLLELPQSYFDNELTGKIISRLNRSIMTVTTFMKQMTNAFVQFMVTAIVTLIIIAYYAWPVALFLAALFPLYFWLTKLSSNSWKEKQGKINADTDYAQGRFAEVVGQIRVVKSFVQEKLEFRVFKKQFDNITVNTRAQSRRWHKYDIYRNLSLSFVLFITYLIIARNTFEGILTLGEFTLLIQLVFQVRQPLFASSFIVDNIQQAEAGSKDFFEVMSIKPAITDAPSARRLSVRSGEVYFNDVSFGYNHGNTVIKNISFRIKPGTRVALIGQSGEGKSTIANLLLRLYEPTKGSISIDGQDIGKVTQLSLRQNVAVVFQDASLFSGTIIENINYGKPRASKAEIEAAAKAANAHHFIKKLPEGYNTEIGERGIKLSGGQKQRIAIARAILKDAPILILDEATSSLDSKSELEVQKALNHLMRGRTTLIIAHRLSTIRDVDAIVSLKGGKVAEYGSPAQLRRRHGIYAELLALQDPTKANKKQLKRYEIVAS